MSGTKVEELPDRIAGIFEGREILLTGGTGFLGKVLIEKFLRCIPNVGRIHLLVRPKKGKDPKQRLNEIFNSPVSNYRAASATLHLIPLENVQRRNPGEYPT